MSQLKPAAGAPPRSASCTFYFITHPNVEVRPDIPVPDWPLSEEGHSRMRASLRLPWVASIGAIFSSCERKATDSAVHLANHLSLPVNELAELGENDRTATGYLPAHEFERLADAFFAAPDRSVRGWERAVDAQKRVVAAAHKIEEATRGLAAVAIVSHGAVGTLLYCHLMQQPISRRFDQPPNGGGNYFSYSLSPPTAHGGWRAIDEHGV
jgi:broad specificity phosphatase PhoE